MTEGFKYVLHNESNLCQAIIEVMGLDMSEEELKILTLYRPFFSLVDNYISYYQKKSDVSPQIPIFYMLGANDDMRKLLVKFLTIRLGIFNEKSISNIRKDIAFFNTHGLHIPTAGTQEYKSFNRKVQYDGKATCFGYALSKFKRKINNIASSLSETDKSEYNLLICKDSEVCDSRGIKAYLLTLIWMLINLRIELKHTTNALRILCLDMRIWFIIIQTGLSPLVKDVLSK